MTANDDDGILVQPGDDGWPELCEACHTNGGRATQRQMHARRTAPPAPVVPAPGCARTPPGLIASRLEAAEDAAIEAAYHRAIAIDPRPLSW